MRPSIWNFAGDAARTVFTARTFQESAVLADPAAVRCGLVEAPDAAAASAATARTALATSTAPSLSTVRLPSLFMSMLSLVVAALPHQQRQSSPKSLAPRCD